MTYHVAVGFKITTYCTNKMSSKNLRLESFPEARDGVRCGEPNTPPPSQRKGMSNDSEFFVKRRHLFSSAETVEVFVSL